MATTAQEQIAFLSYTRRDDEHERGRITEIRKQLQSEVEVQTGRPFQIFQDQENISVGQPWRTQIQLSIDNTSLLIAVVTPSFLLSSACRDEVSRFIRREQELGRDDLIIPVVYIPTPALTNADDEVARVLRERQFADWTELRFEELSSSLVRRKISELATGIVAALQRDLETPSDSAKKSIAKDDEQPGFIEIVADAENTMPHLYETIVAWGEELNSYSEVLRNATERMQAADQPGRPAAARITIMHQLKEELEEPVSRMEFLADQYVEQLAVVAAGMGAMTSRVPEIDDPEEIDAARQLYASLEELVSTAEHSATSTRKLKESVVAQYKLSSTLRPTLRCLVNALTKFEPTVDEYTRRRDDLKLALAAHDTD